MVDKPFLTIRDILSSAQSRCILLRHDVDRRPARSVAMAKLEAKKNISATYYFRITKTGQFPVQAVKDIAALGHECGYHYEVLSDCKGDMAAASELFKKNLAGLREIVTVDTVSMHGAPLSPHDNQDFGDTLNFSEYGLKGDAVRTVEKFDPLYFTDTGGIWADGKANLRDRVGTRVPELQPDEVGFRDYVEQSEVPIYISTHPERWPSGTIGQLQARLRDGGVNVVKRTLRATRS